MSAAGRPTVHLARSRPQQYLIGVVQYLESGEVADTRLKVSTLGQHFERIPLRAGRLEKFVFGNQSTGDDREEVIFVHDDVRISIRRFRVTIETGKQSAATVHPFPFGDVVFFPQEYDHRQQVVVEALRGFYAGISVDEQLDRRNPMLAVQNMILRQVPEGEQAKALSHRIATRQEWWNRLAVHFDRSPRRLAIGSGHNDGRDEPIRSAPEIPCNVGPYQVPVQCPSRGMAESRVLVNVKSELHVVSDLAHLHSENIIWPVSHPCSNCGIDSHGLILSELNPLHAANPFIVSKGD